MLSSTNAVAVARVSNRKREALAGPARVCIVLPTSAVSDAEVPER